MPLFSVKLYQNRKAASYHRYKLLVFGRDGSTLLILNMSILINFQKAFSMFIFHCVFIIFLTDPIESSREYVTRSATDTGDGNLNGGIRNDGNAIQGFISERISGKPVEQYLGIPYAEPPVGNLRFEPPRPTSWVGTLDATTLPPACIQYDNMYYIQEHYPGFDRSSEDCLYLNVYVPRLQGSRLQEQLLPVLFYIHGGSNRAGMGSMLEGDILAGHAGIIVVTLNYRLGIFGFLAAKNEGLDGTYGFLDQIMAMRWVKDNIRMFGGDPDLVTIDGHSAGAADVGFHIISPLARGLFKRAIIHSGSPLGFWAMSNPRWPAGYNVDPLCDDEDCADVPFKQFMRNKRVEDMRRMNGKGMPNNLITFPAVIDGNYLTEDPETTFRRGGESLNGESYMIAFARDEGFPMDDFIFNYYYSNIGIGNVSLYIDPYKTVFPQLCNFSDIVVEEYEEYKNKTPAAQLLNRVESDLVFFSPMIKLANIMSESTDDLYVFSFDHRSPLARQVDWQGIPHGIDLFYLFGVPLVGHAVNNYTNMDIKASKVMMSLWGNFIRDGVLKYQDTEFSSYKTDTKAYHHLYSQGENIHMGTNNDFRSDKMEFWNDILPNRVCSVDVSSYLDVSVGKLVENVNSSSSLCQRYLLRLFIISLLLHTCGILINFH